MNGISYMYLPFSESISKILLVSIRLTPDQKKVLCENICGIKMLNDSYCLFYGTIFDLN